MRWLAIAHHLPERTRLRSPVLRRDPPLCERLADALAALPVDEGVRWAGPPLSLPRGSARRD